MIEIHIRKIFGATIPIKELLVALNHQIDVYIHMRLECIKLGNIIEGHNGNKGRYSINP